MRKCRFAQRLLSSLCALALTAGAVPAALAAPSFSDVAAGAWFKPYADKAVDAGLMEGIGSGQFGPGGHLTLAQAAVLAYRLHSRSGGGALPQTGGPWYMPYYQYCLDNGIFTAGQVPLDAIGRDATRYEMVSILDKAVPAGQLEAINPLPDGFIPDLSESDDFGAAVYRWYRAGALTGGEQYRFNGGSSITRAEVAVILCQLEKLVDRVKLDITPATGTKAVAAVNVTLKTALTAGETAAASVSIVPGDAADKAVTWSSSAPSVASVDAGGRVTALSPGTAVITAASANGVKGSVTVTVSAAADPRAFLDEVVRLTNAERAKEGLAPLATYDALTRAAAIRAPEIVELFSHTRPDGTACFTALDETGASQGAYTYGENIAAGNATPAATVEQWMNSPGHRANIMNPDYTHMGVGYAAGGTYRHYWVQLFAGRSDTPAAPQEVTALAVSLSKTTLEVGGTAAASVTVTPSTAANKTVTWTSGNTAVATVDASGRVTAVGAGSAEITATAANGVKASRTVTVTAPAPAPAPTPDPAPDAGSKAFLDEVVRLTNAERAKEGLAPLATYDALTRAAAIRAPEIVELFSHTRPDGTACFTALDETGASQGAYTYGENIAAGNATPAATVEQWMNSPGHRANIMNPDYTHIGVGYAAGGAYRHCWVQLFAGRSDTPTDASTAPSAQRQTTATALPPSGLTDRYRQDWEDGQYLELRVTGGSTVTFSGCVNTDPSYNYAFLRATGSQSEVPLTPGVPFTVTTQVNLDTLQTLYSQDPSPGSVLIALLCQSHTPGASNVAGFAFRDVHDIRLALDENGGCLLKITPK